MKRKVVAILTMAILATTTITANATPIEGFNVGITKPSTGGNHDIDVYGTIGQAGSSTDIRMSVPGHAMWDIYVGSTNVASANHKITNVGLSTVKVALQAHTGTNVPINTFNLFLDTETSNVLTTFKTQTPLFALGAHQTPSSDVVLTASTGLVPSAVLEFEFSGDVGTAPTTETKVDHALSFKFEIIP